MKLSVIIVNYNVKYYLEQCLLSVFAAMKNTDAEVFVVDNNSSDGSIEYLRPKFPEVIFIENHSNPGFSKANNQAIEAAKGKYILLLNPDTVITENTLDNVCHFMDEHSDAGGLGVKMIDGYGTFLPESKRGFPSPWNSLCKMSGIAGLFPKSPVFAKYHLKYLNENETHQVDVLSGAFMLLRRETLEKTGSLDETFFMYGEDIDLSYRITKAGYKNYYLPEKIIHYKGESTKKDLRYVKIFYEAMLIFFKKHYPHYDRFYTYLIYSGIYTTGALSAVKRLFIRITGRNITGRQEPGDNISGKDTIFNTQEKTYEEIITVMDSSKNKKTRFWIYHPENQIAISSETVLTDKKI
ncbi:MAG: glycosyltransferase family 2 protein [Dysgonamonadaceae bacterium]|jgi:GT2 family glycosyltransferase|nr:glycosyltransferase family 2 protein [Dysgonamonadaceae bacterium]